MYAGYSPGYGNDTLKLAEEEESHALEHWKDPYLPCCHHHRCGALSGRLERLAPIQPSVVSSCPLSRRRLPGDDDNTLIHRTLVALATLARSGRSSNGCRSDPRGILGTFLSCPIRPRYCRRGPRAPSRADRRGTISPHGSGGHHHHCWTWMVP